MVWLDNAFYEQYAKNVHSQNGEDGVIAEVLRRLGIDGGWVVESGAWDGVHLSNTFALVERGSERSDHICGRGFRALYIEADAAKFQDLLATVGVLPAGKIVPVNARLESDSDSLGDIMTAHGVNDAAAVLSIDIDSHDYDVWKNLDPEHRPVVVVIEINSGVHPMDWKIYGRDGWTDGTSFLPMLLLGAEKGYTLVAHTGNMVFVRNDLWPKLGLPVTNPVSMFRTNWLRGVEAVNGSSVLRPVTSGT